MDEDDLEIYYPIRGRGDPLEFVVPLVVAAILIYLLTMFGEVALNGEEELVGAECFSGGCELEGRECINEKD